MSDIETDEGDVTTTPVTLATIATSTESATPEAGVLHSTCMGYLNALCLLPWFKSENNIPKFCTDTTLSMEPTATQQLSTSEAAVTTTTKTTTIVVNTETNVQFTNATMNSSLTETEASTTDEGGHSVTFISPSP